MEVVVVRVAATAAAVFVVIVVLMVVVIAILVVVLVVVLVVLVVLVVVVVVVVVVVKLFHDTRFLHEWPVLCSARRLSPGAIEGSIVVDQCGIITTSCLFQDSSLSI